VNKFATKSCKRFPPRLDNASTLPCENASTLPCENASTLLCETGNAHHARAGMELLQKETPEIISS